MTKRASLLGAGFLGIIQRGHQLKNDKKTVFGDAETFIKKIETKGYSIQKGRYEELDTTKLASEGKLISCFGNNAGSSYSVIKLPDAPGQRVPNPTFEPAGWSYKLREDEAIVMIGTLPPECKYFAYGNYILLTEEKANKDYSNSKGYFQIKGTTAVGNYHPIFGSIGDQINNKNVRFLQRPGYKKGNPYGAPFVMVMTGSKKTNQTVCNALRSAGFSRSVINQKHLPATALKMGLDKGKDTFCMLGRISQPKDQAVYNRYMAALSENTKVYRLTPQGKTEGKLYDMEAIPARGTGTSEVVQMPYVKEDLDRIREKLIEDYQAEYTYEELKANIAVPEGMTGYQNDENAQGDNRDTSYLMTDDFRLNKDEDFIIIYGVNHVKTGKAIYANAVLYGRPMLNGVTSIYDSLYKGTAGTYLKEAHNDIDDYYVYKLARTQIDQQTAVIPYSTGNKKGKFYGVDNGQKLLLAYRAYIEKATGIGPSYYEIVYDRAIVFHKK